MTDTLSGKVIIISGASSGIGEATAHLLASKGAKLILSARREDALNKVANQLSSQFGGNVIAVAGDVSQRRDVDRLVQTACDTYGRLDVFVSNVGMMDVAPLKDLKVDAWDAMIDINIKGLTNAVYTALPIFQKQDSGHFVTVASTSGLMATPTMVMYAGTKHAVRAIMDGLRKEMVPHIRATTITPGVTKTKGTEALSSQISALLKIAMDPMAVAKCIAFAIEQPPEVNIGEIIVRSTAQP